MNRVICRSNWFIILTILLGGCRDVIVASPPKTPIPLRVAYTPALRPWIDSLASCAQNQPNIVLFLDELPADQLSLNQYDAILRLSSESHTSEYTFVLGYDDLVIIVNSLNPVTSLNEIGLQDLFSGRMDMWEKLSPPNAIYLVTVQAYTYMPGSDLSWVEIFGKTPELLASPEARLVYDPGQVIEGVKEEEGGIGIIPSSWLTADILGLKIIESPIKVKVPVLVITKSKPFGPLRELLGCASKL